MILFGTKGSLFVMCDVGNGDALYIRTSNQLDILIDFGSREDVLDCLGRYMPFMDRTIELAFVSHQHEDHYGGLRYVLRKYHIQKLVLPDGTGTSKQYLDLVDTAKKTGTQIMSIHELINSRSRVRLSNKESLSCLYPGSIELPAIRKQEKSDENAFSPICVYSQGSQDILLTGDATPRALSQIIKQDLLASYGHIELMKVPHHGSKIGLTEEFLAYVNPTIALISVARDNSYGHPSPEVIGMLARHNVDTFLTSRDSDVVVKITPDGTFSAQ